MVRSLSRVFLIFASLVFLTTSSFAAELKSTKTLISDELTQIKPKWPRPNDPNQLFYLQRSISRHVVVYGARYDNKGFLNRRDPTNEYWRRLATSGKIERLSGLERRFAYGVRTKSRREPGEFTVTLRPLPQFPMLLRQTAPGKSELLATIAGRTANPIYGFVKIDQSGLIPKVTEFSIHGKDVATGEFVSEWFSVTGGAVRP